MNRWILVATALGALVFAGGCVNREAQAQARRTEQIVNDPVQLVSAQRVGVKTLTQDLVVTGEVVTNEDSQVGAKVGGRLVTVSVKDGDLVTAGQVMATLETEQLSAGVQQALAVQQQAIAGLRAAQSQLSQAVSNERLAPARSSAGVRQAVAALRSAEAQLKKAREGARPEERAQADAALEAAKTNLSVSEWELERLQKLFDEGAIPEARLKGQVAVVAGARAQLENAQQTVNLIRSGTRIEDIRSAEEAVRQAEEGVRAARAQQDLDVLLKDQVQSAKAQVESARAQVDSANAAVRLAQINLDDSVIRAPFAGTISGRPLQIGTVVGPGTPVVRIIGLDGAYFNAQVPAARIDEISPGKSVSIRIDGIENRTFSGSIIAISPAGETVGRQFDVRIQINGDTSNIRPGMFARGSVRVRTIPAAMVVPASAVIKEGEQSFVFLAEGDAAKKVPVVTGIEQAGSMQVSGLATTARVIVKGQRTVQDGSRIREESVSAENTAGGQGS